MSFPKLRSHLKALSVDDHIISGRKGNNANVKNKIVIPFLQTLGWDLLRDMDFNHLGLDIVLFSQGNPAMIVEVNSWDDKLDNDLHQYLEFGYRLNCPWVFLSTGRENAFYCALLDQHDFAQATPLLEFSLEDLIGRSGSTIFNNLSSLMGKKDFFKKGGRLYKGVSTKLGEQTIEDAQIEFVKTASQRVRGDRTRQLTVESFLSHLQHHSRQVSGALVYLHHKMVNLLPMNKRLSIRYRNKGVGLEYEMAGNPAEDLLPLFDVFPESGRITFGQESWKKLNISITTFEQMKALSRQAESFAWAREVGTVLEKALREIKRFR
ncbi:MAG: hypothetical protein QNJ61_11460 [Desulfobacterales bacterium]|nr:hypothetical protein [Desulfobacterales bacterium]